MPLPPADIARIQSFERAMREANAKGSDLTDIIVRSDGGRYAWSMSMLGSGTDQVPMVRGRLIIFTKDLSAVMERVSGYEVSQSNRCLDRLGLTVLESSRSASAVQKDITRLGSDNLVTGFDPILALNKWTIKGSGGAEPTDRRLGNRPSSGAGKGAVVAIIDNGINVDTHDETGARGRTDGWLDGIRHAGSNTDPLFLENELLHNTMPGTGAPYLDDTAGHGTFVAGIVRRVAPAATVHMLKAFNSDGISDDFAVACRILQAVDLKADVINLSLGSQTWDGKPSIATARAVALVPRTTAIVAAAGNMGSTAKVFPAAIPRVIAVGALNYKGTAGAGFSSRGPWVDASSIGQGVVSTYVDGVERPTYDPDLPDSWSGRNPIAMWSGTSFAAPQLAGLIARATPSAGSGTSAYNKIRALYRNQRLLNFGLRIPILRQ